MSTVAGSLIHVNNFVNAVRKQPRVSKSQHDSLVRLFIESKALIKSRFKKLNFYCDYQNTMSQTITV